MSTPAEFRGYTPAEVAEITGLYSEHELRRLAAEFAVPHHRGSRNKVVFFPDDIKDLIRAARRTPAKSRGEDTPPLDAVQEAKPSPFRTTSRSRAAHRSRQTA